jgi:hypothetical protein
VVLHRPDRASEEQRASRKATVRGGRLENGANDLSDLPH